MTLSMCDATHNTPLWSSAYEPLPFLGIVAFLFVVVRIQTGFIRCNSYFFRCAKLGPLVAWHFICDCPVFATGTVLPYVNAV